jgi:peroxiredoxin
MKRIILYGLIIVLLGGTRFLVVKTYQKIEHKKVIAHTIQQLPAVSIKTIGGETALLSPKVEKASILLFFNTECEHCQYEAMEAKKQIGKFDKTQLYFLSPEPLDSLYKFAKRYGLASVKNITVAHIEPVLLSNSFGIRGFPTVFIYDSNGKLQKKFDGEVKIDAIIKYVL